VNVVERLWNLHRHAIVDACHFGVATAADHPHDTVADGKAGDCGTDSDDFAPAIDIQAHKRGVAEVRTAVTASAAASTPCTWKTDLAMLNPMTVCMGTSSESWEP
jgi:hypothetical protein